jgi:biopolymer transport protein ExbB
MSAFMSFFTYLLKGGPVMYPLFLCALVALFVMIERAIAVSRANIDTEGFLAEISALLRDQRREDALALATRTRGPVASLVANGLRNSHLAGDAIERAMEELALRETPRLRKNLGVLDTVITAAPLLGLLGTVTGMIRAFHVVGLSSLNSAPTAITGGVAEALIATATGLTIAIVTLVGYNYLVERVKTIVSDMETRATQLLNMLAEQRYASADRGTAQQLVAGGK